jgi:seryl-tRNA synthetase
MWPLDRLYHTLRDRGELWEPMPGLVGLRGQTARLYRALGERIASLCGIETDDEWRVPAAIPLAALERADYFASFPQWLTLAGHLSDDEEQLRRVAQSTSPAASAMHATVPTGAALTPAVCYHVYAALAGQRVVAPRIMTAQTTCWRHEHPNHTALERDWAFTMREVVCVGADTDVRAFVDRVSGRVSALAETLGLEPRIVEATDPFFAPTARGKELLQRIQALKHELMLPVSEQRSIAASSFNLHQTFFGEAFDIRDGNGAPVHTGCVAFGIERWTLAFLVRHGPDPEAWPSFMEDAYRVGAAHDVVTY